MSIVVAGATGKLGGFAVEALVERGIEPSEIVAAGRNAERLTGFADRGMRTAIIDGDDPTTLRSAFDGAQKVLFVSVNGNPQRVAQHQNIIDAAKDVGVELIAYTSFAHADISSTHGDHYATEQALQSSGVPFVVLRNPMYFEYRTRSIPSYRERGEIVGASGEGRTSAASRAELGEAAAVVVTSAGHEGATYELGGDEGFTMTEFAAELSKQTGEDIPFVNLSPEELKAGLIESGMSEAFATATTKVDVAVAAGEHFSDTGDLRRILGRPSMTLSEAIAYALRSPDVVYL
jgi:NAD(P)H dehydrogenase (quinone)